MHTLVFALAACQYVSTRADPESFVREGCFIIFFLDFFSLMRGGMIQIPLSAGHRRPTSETPFRWRADCGPTLNTGFVALLF